MLSKICFVFLPLSLYYMFIGGIGVGKYALRRRLDTEGEPWWEHADFVPPGKEVGVGRWGESIFVKEGADGGGGGGGGSGGGGYDLSDDDDDDDDDPVVGGGLITHLEVN
jgi:hypothetical protein